MGTSKASTPTKLLENIKSAQDFQHVDNWFNNTKRMISYLSGDYGQQMYKTKYIVNTIYNLINLIIPNLYFQDPKIIVRPSKPYFINDDGLKINGYKRSQLCQEVLNSEIRNMGYKNETRKVIQDTLLCTFGVMKIGRSGNTIHEDDMSYLDDGDIFAQRISPFDYLFDPMSTSPNNSRYEIYRYVDSLASVKANKMLRGTGDLEGTSLTEGPKKSKKEKSKEANEWIELYEYHDHEKDKVYILTRDSGNKKRKLYDEDKKYEFKGSDFSVMKFTSDNDSFRGISPMAMVEDEALAINEVLSLMLNHLQKFPGVILHEEGALDTDDIERFEYGSQGDILQVQNGALREGRVKRESPLSAGGDYYNNFNMLSGSIDRTLAIPDFRRSAASGKRKTALEVNVSANDESNRRGYFVSFVKDFVIESSGKVLSLMQQFYDEKRWQNMYGEFTEWNEWTRDDIQGEYTFDLDVEDLKAYSSSKAQAIMQTIQMLAPIEFFKPVFQKVDPYKMATKIFKNMDLDLKSVEKQEDLAHYEHDPYKENELLLAGKHIMDPHPGEPHEDHNMVHGQALLKAQKDEDQKVLQETMRHIEMHKYWMQVIPMVSGTLQPPVQGQPGQGPQQGQGPQGPQQGQGQGQIKSGPEIEGNFSYKKDMKEQL